MPTNLADVPQPRLATIDLGVAAPGFDGSGSFYSYDSDLSPEETIAAYANQLLRAGFREVDRIGIWRVFVGPRLTVWVRVGSGGPPTSLVVRVQPNEVEVADEPGSRPAAPAPRDQATSGTGGQAGSSGPKPTTRPAAQRRPDPPHGTGATAAGSGSGGGTTIAGGTAAAGSTGSGTITGAGGVGTGGGR